MKRWIIISIVSCFIIIFFVIRIFFIAFFNVPSRAMEKTILSNSRIVVLKSKKQPERFNIVAFRFPEGDTVCIERSNESYYSILRDESANLKSIDLVNNLTVKSDDEYSNLARKKIRNEYTLDIRPLNKRDIYIKRCVGLPGDTILISDGVLYINGKEEPLLTGRQTNYRITVGTQFNPRRIEELGIYQDDMVNYGTFYVATLTDKNAKIIASYKNVLSIEKEIQDSEETMENLIFPHSKLYPWNIDHFGPLYTPQKGKTISLSFYNLPLYKRIIGYYEGNKLEVKDSAIYINGEIASSYTFKQNYYWMMGDNRHSTLDSRYWGYVPENHIMGRLLSTGKK